MFSILFCDVMVNDFQSTYSSTTNFKVFLFTWSHIITCYIDRWNSLKLILLIYFWFLNHHYIWMTSFGTMNGKVLPILFLPRHTIKFGAYFQRRSAFKKQHKTNLNQPTKLMQTSWFPHFMFHTPSYIWVGYSEAQVYEKICLKLDNFNEFHFFLYLSYSASLESSPQ